MQDDWYRRAELALGKGEEELAREALKRRKAYAVRTPQRLLQEPPLSAKCSSLRPGCSCEACSVCVGRTTQLR